MVFTPNSMYGQRLLVSLNSSPLLRTASLTLRHPGHKERILSRVATSSSTRVHTRFAASSVSGRPGSQSVEHATQNVKEEVGNSLTDWARSIAGGVFTVNTVKPKADSFVSKIFLTTHVPSSLPRNHSLIIQQVGITSAIATKVPTPALVMGLAGGLPYIASAGTTVYLAHQAWKAAMGIVTNIDPGVALTVLDQALDFQVHYGAVMLSFLGTSHVVISCLADFVVSP